MYYYNSAKLVFFQELMPSSRHSTDNYRWEPSQPANQGQPTHSSISQPSYYPSGLAGHGSDGARSPHPPVSPYTPHSVDGLPGRLSNTLFEPPFPRHTGGHMGSPMIPNSFDVSLENFTPAQWLLMCETDPTISRPAYSVIRYLPP
jgi:hypothetical protein